MKIKFLGTSFGAPSIGRHQQSILLETDRGNSYLFDAGAPVLDILVNENYDLTKIKAVFLSHMHGDHINGIFDIIYLSQYFQMKYDILLPDAKGMEFLKSYMKLQHMENCDLISFKEIKESVFFNDGDIKVSAVSTNHIDKAKGNSYGFIIEADGKKTYISGDLHSSLNDFPKFSEDESIELAIVECAHFSPESLFRKLEGVKINRVAVVHVMPPEKYEDLRFCIKTLTRKIILPADGDIIEI